MPRNSKSSGQAPKFYCFLCGGNEIKGLLPYLKTIPSSKDFDFSTWNDKRWAALDVADYVLGKYYDAATQPDLTAGVVTCLTEKSVLEVAAAIYVMENALNMRKSEVTCYAIPTEAFPVVYDTSVQVAIAASDIKRVLPYQIEKWYFNLWKVYGRGLSEQEHRMAEICKSFEAHPNDLLYKTSYFLERNKRAFQQNLLLIGNKA